MDWLVILFVAALVAALAGALWLALVRGRELERLGELSAAADDGEGALERRVRELIDRTAAAEWSAGQAASEMRYLGDLIGVGVVRLGDAGRIDFANAAAHTLLRVPAGSLVGRTTLEAFVDERIEGIADASRRQGAATGEVTLRDADARTVIVRGRRSPIRGIWLVLEDVSELRRLQQIRAEFIDNLSHELRTPLTTVSLLAETLAREAGAVPGGLPGRMQDRIAKIEVETGHLVQMVAELLDLSRIESGGPLALLDDVDLARLATASVDRLRLFAERQGVRLETVVAAGLPTVRGNEERLGQVLVNLLHNAVKFSPDGGTVTVRVERADAATAVVAVEDHGIGIPAGARTRIFERFYKVDRARVRGGGTGLGLAIARHIVEAHGGRLRVESEEGVGSTFFVEIPFDTAHSEARGPDDRARDAVTPESTGAPADAT